jgi:hypothetical protein
MSRNCLLKQVIGGKVPVAARRGRRRKQVADDITEKGSYWNENLKALKITIPCPEPAMEVSMDLSQDRLHFNMTVLRNRKHVLHMICDMIYDTIRYDMIRYDMI